MNLTPRNGKPVTMTSLELVEFINSQRNDDEAELRHDHFLAKVPQVLGERGLPKFRDTYKHQQNGQTYPMYRFPKREACLMAMSYSYEIQAKVFDRMTALEDELKKVGPSGTALDKLRTANALKLAEETAAKLCARFSKLGESAQQVIYAKIINPIVGDEVLMLPRVEEKLKLAGEIGTLLGVSGNKIGRLSNQYGMKTAEYGEFRLDKSEYSSKQVETFYYNAKAVEMFRMILDEEATKKVVPISGDASHAG